MRLAGAYRLSLPIAYSLFGLPFLKKTSRSNATSVPGAVAQSAVAGGGLNGIIFPGILGHLNARRVGTPTPAIDQVEILSRGHLHFEDRPRAIFHIEERLVHAHIRHRHRAWWRHRGVVEIHHVRREVVVSAMEHIH